MRTIFSERLKILRDGETVVDVANRFGVSQPTWTTWELGTREPNIAMITKICLCYGVRVDWLFGLSDEDGPAKLLTKTGGASKARIKAEAS